MDFVKKVTEAIDIKRQLLENKDIESALEKSITLIVDSLKSGGKILFCGNGGSAADAQHLAAELAGRFYLDRAPLYAEALHVNSSFVTAVANDYSFEKVFERMTIASGRPGDVLFALSTSGNSPNIINALEAARDCKMKTIGLSGNTGGKMYPLCDVLFKIPSEDTPRIQEVHIFLGHLICEEVEARMFI